MLTGLQFFSIMIVRWGGRQGYAHILARKIGKYFYLSDGFES